MRSPEHIHVGTQNAAENGSFHNVWSIPLTNDSSPFSTTSLCRTTDHGCPWVILYTLAAFPWTGCMGAGQSIPFIYFRDPVSLLNA